MMRGARLSVTFLASLSALTVSCSLIKVSDEVGRQQCINSKQCRDRLEKPSGFNECFEWQCNRHSFCELLPIDRDEDETVPLFVLKDSCQTSTDSGATAEQCALADDSGCTDCFRDCRTSLAEKGISTDKVVDCQDSDRKRSGNQMESCDGIDNDCDQTIDEGVLTSNSSGRTVVVFSGENRYGISSTGYAVDTIDRDESRIAVAFNLNRSPVVPGVAVIPSSDQDSSVTAQPLIPSVDGYRNPSLVSEGIGISSMGEGQFAVAIVDNKGSRRVIVGLVDASSPTQLQIDPDIYERGLSCTEDEDCSTQTPATFTPVMGSLNRDVLVMYLRGDFTKREKSICGNLSESQPLLANLVHRRAGVLQEVSQYAVSLGSSMDLAPPAIVRSPAQEDGLEDTPLGWLISFSDEENNISITHVTYDDQQAALVGSELVSIPSQGKSQGDVSMALGPDIDGVFTLGIAFRRGCSQESQILAEIFELRREEDSSFSLNSLTGTIDIDSSVGVRHPSIVYSEPRESWVVLYTNGLDTLWARVLDRSGKLRYDQPYTLLEAKSSDPTTIPFTPLAFPSTRENGWFNAFIYTRSTDDSGRDASAVKSFSLGCG